MDSLLLKAVEIAKTSPGVGRNKNYRVGAVLFDKRGKVLSTGTNSYKTHPRLKRFTEYPYQHAESNCIISSGLGNLTDLSLMVTRVTARSECTMAAPCSCCCSFLEYQGLKNVYYTNWKGKIECLKLK